MFVVKYITYINKITLFDNKCKINYIFSIVFTC